jgi:hypothetical protein
LIPPFLVENGSHRQLLIPQPAKRLSLFANNQGRLFKPEKYNGGMCGVNPFFKYCFLLCRPAPPDGSNPHYVQCYRLSLSFQIDLTPKGSLLAETSHALKLKANIRRLTQKT